MDKSGGIDMKFLHLADVHLGVKPDRGFNWSENRRQEVWENFRYVVEICNKEDVDLLLIAGDFFHKQPLVRELKEVNYIFSTIKETKVVIIAGNHDYISHRSNYINFDWSPNVHMLLNREVDSIYFEDINTEVYGFSYHQREIKEDFLKDVTIKHRDRINILLAHGGTANNLPFDLKTLEVKGFDYIALGHIHKPQKLGERIAYAGSIEPTDKNDIGKRGYIIGQIDKEDINKGSSISFKYRTSSIREYIYIDIEVSDTMTNSELQDLVKESLAAYDQKNIFVIILNGYRDPDVTFNTEPLYKLANVIEVRDESLANYDFKTLYLQNKDNIIGSFISAIKNCDEAEDIKTRALYYGIEALLYGKEG